MNSIWMLAAAQPEPSSEGQVITEEPAGTEQGVTTQNGSNGPAANEQTPSLSQKHNTLFLVMMGILVVYMFFIMFRGPKKKQQEHQKMVQSLRKNDRVRTIGGIFGTVLDVRDDEVVLKIDESTNTKMRVSPTAIATVLKDKTE
jgi:preprotein translocase subunit YajC